MKKEILLNLGIWFCVNSFSQNITITDSQIREKNDKVYVNFIVEIDKIKSDERLILTPVLFNGDKKANLTSVVLSGRNRSITDKRKSRSPGIRANKGQRIPYNVTVPYESWMSEISLMIESKVESCCTERNLPPQAVLKGELIRYEVILPPILPITPALSPIEKLDIEVPFLATMKEYVALKGNSDIIRAEGALIVRFQQGKNIIDPSYEDNAKSLEQVCSVLKLIAEDPNASVDKIVLAGASSPEGANKRNDQLAQKRIQVLKHYLKEKANTDISLIESVNLGEDWVGARKMIEESDMQYKQEVLAIIDNVPIEHGREKQLMDLKWGQPYNYMLKHFFPKLRSAGYIRIFYESKPDEELANINKAIDMYNKREYSDVLTRLVGVKPTAVTENIRGVCYMMLSEYDRAESALTKAVVLGNPQASESLEQLKKLQTIRK